MLTAAGSPASRPWVGDGGGVAVAIERCLSRIDSRMPENGTASNILHTSSKCVIYGSHVMSDRYLLNSSRKMTAFWNTIKRNRTTKVKSALCHLCASDFKGVCSDVVQALPGSIDKEFWGKPCAVYMVCMVFHRTAKFCKRSKLVGALIVAAFKKNI